MTRYLDLGLAQPLIRIPEAYSRHADDENALGDAAGGLSYVFTTELALAVNAALATRRPLLLRGAPGSGKSTFARAIAEVGERPFLLKVVSSDSKLDDLLWRYDYIRRLQDASDDKRTVQADYEYVEPQALWWALAPRAALGRGEPYRKPRRAVAPPITIEKPPVLLLDEIDKADPALPNDLLVALGEGKFTIRETGELVVAEHAPLIMITTNEERELSRPFVRRCIVVELPQRKGKELFAWFALVGRAHFPDQERLVDDVATFLVERSAEPPSVAELVDLLRACVKLGVTAEHAQFELMRRLIADKSRAPQSGG